MKDSTVNTDDSISSVDTHITSLDVKSVSDNESDTDSSPGGQIVNCIQEIDTSSDNNQHSSDIRNEIDSSMLHRIEHSSEFDNVNNHYFDTNELCCKQSDLIINKVVDDTYTCSDISCDKILHVNMKPHNSVDSKIIHCVDIDEVHCDKSHSLSSNVVDDSYTFSAISNDSSQVVLDCTTPLRSNGINHILFIVNDEHTKQYITQVPDFLPPPDINWKTEISNNYIILDGLEGDTRIYCQRC